MKMSPSSFLPKTGPQAALCLTTNEHGGCLSDSDREGVLRAGLAANPAGGQQGEGGSEDDEA